MAKRKQPSSLPMAQLTEVEKADIERIEREAFLNFEGEFDDIEKAVGILRLGYHIGWKPLVLMHSKRTIAKYEEILNITFRTTFPPEGPSAERSAAYRFSKKLANFWKAVSGETPVEDRQRFTRVVQKET